MQLIRRLIPLFTLLSSVLLIVTINFIDPTAKERVFDQTFDQMNLSLFNKDYKKNEKIYIFSKSHHEIYISSYKIFLENNINALSSSPSRWYGFDLM